MPSKDEPKSEHRGLRLVAAGGTLIDKAIADEKPKQARGLQLELFGKANSLLFADTRVLCFSDLRELCFQQSIRQILDLRKVPFLNFPGVTRCQFLEYLDTRGIDYISVFSIASHARTGSLTEWLDSSDDEPFLSQALKRIGYGPTLVLIQKNRRSDIAADRFCALLSKSKIPFSEILP